MLLNWDCVEVLMHINWIVTCSISVGHRWPSVDCCNENKMNEWMNVASSYKCS
jgi:hypothetical protein